MKKDSNFRMKKSVKRMLSTKTFTDAHRRGEIKRLFISAQLSEMEAERSKYSKSSDNTDS